MLSDPEKFPIILLSFLVFLVLLVPGVHAARLEEGSGEDVIQEEMTLHYFYMHGCPACSTQERFLEERGIFLKEDGRYLEEVQPEDYPYLTVKTYDVYEPGTDQVLRDLAERYGHEDVRMVTPTTFLDGELFQGFDENKGERMMGIIEGEDVEDDGMIEVPFFGRIHPEDLPLPLLAFALGSVDGMNVCSIGALVMVLMIVLSFDNRKKIFFYGFLFILTVVLIYGLIIFTWYHILEAVMKHLGILQYVIGAAGIIGGAVFFKQFIEFYRHGPNCEYSQAGFVTKARIKVKESFEGKQAGPIALIGSVILFAAVVTLIELPCSAALPLAFSGVLVDAQLVGLTYVFYIGLYLFFYMLIELVIFTGAVITKEIWFGSGKFVTWVTLIGALILFFLGISYLFGIGIA